MTMPHHAGQDDRVPAAAGPALATDPDVDLHDAGQRREFGDHPAMLLATIATGGALGALARAGVGTALTHPAGSFAWSTFLINVTGCFVLGAVMVVVTELTTPHRLVRPFLGVGMLGGYTTFSTSILDFHQMVSAGAARTGLAYLAGMLMTGLAAVYLGSATGRMLGRVLRRGGVRRR